MPEYTPGTITTERVVVIICANCHEEDSAPFDQTFAAKAFRDRGWSKTEKHGWLCGKCKLTY